MKSIYLTISILSLSLLSFSQITTQPLSKTNDPSAGWIYSLPKTEITVEVETRKTIETPGIYGPYAERFLGLTNVCQAENIRYEIIGIKISTNAKVDLQNTYIILSGKGKNVPAIDISPEGFLSSIGDKNGLERPISQTEKQTKPDLTTSYQSQETSITTQEMQQASSTIKIAELAAAQLFNLRDSRLNLLTQDLDKTPADGRSYEIILSELNRMEKYYRELFTGKKVESTEIKTFKLDPQKNGEEILFRFSQLKGVLEASNLGGNPVFVQLKKEVGTLADLVKPLPENDKMKFSLYYRIPGKAQIQITDGATVFCNEEIPVAQFGKVVTLPAGTIKSAQLCTKTGALMHLEK